MKVVEWVYLHKQSSTHMYKELVAYGKDEMGLLCETTDSSKKVRISVSEFNESIAGGEFKFLFKSKDGSYELWVKE